MIEEGLEEEVLHEFKGGTLSFNNESKLNSDKAIRGADKNNEPEPTKPNNNYWNTNFILPLSSIHHKISASLWSKEPESTVPTKDNSVLQSITISENPNNFFTFRESVLARALNECKDQFLDDEADGPLLEAFLLTEISHWNSDKERLILLTSQSLVIVKYDFIALKRLSYKKLPLEKIEEIVIGDLVYPSGSLIPNRNVKGVRLIWGKDQPENFVAQWNPFNNDLPYCTFTFHPLFFHKDCIDEKLKNLYCLDAFVEKLVKLCIDLPKYNSNYIPCKIQDREITLQSYIGIGSVIHNRNSLGFFKVRGRFSF